MKFIASMMLGSSLLFAGAVHAAPVYWTDWTGNSARAAEGVINTDSSSVGVEVSSSSNLNFVQLAGAGVNYWNPSTPYISASIDNAPGNSGIISLNTGGTVTINFSSAVVDPLIALVSWNSNTLVFNAPIEIVSYGAGHWGNGTPVLNANGDGIYGQGEVHGVIRVLGTYDTISFTHISENWHGYTVGITAAVPEPESFALLLAGLPLLAAVRRRSKQAA